MGLCALRRAPGRSMGGGVYTFGQSGVCGQNYIHKNPPKWTASGFPITACKHSQNACPTGMCDDTWATDVIEYAENMPITKEQFGHCCLSYTFSQVQ